MSRYKEIEIELDDFSDNELIEELVARGVDGYVSSGATDDELRDILQLMRVGKMERAYAAMYEYIRNKLGVAL